MAVDVQWLRDIARTSGPFATVYLDASHNTPDAPHLIELSWRSSRAELAGAGADEATLAALDTAVARTVEAVDHPSGAVGQVLVAAGGSVLLDRWLPAPPAQAHAHWADAPHLLPALAQLPERLVTVLAVVDATGADLYTGRRAEHLDTYRYPLHQVRGGGLAHLKMRHRVEENERASAADVARAIDDAVADTGADLLVLAGETQSRSRVRRALGAEADRIAEEVDAGGRAPGTAEDELDREAARLVDDRIHALRRDEVRRYREAGGRAVDGVAPVAEALRAAQVDTLYLDPERVSDRKLWLGPEPEQLATDRDQLTALGIDALGPVEAADALVRAAAGTGATVVPVDGEPLADGTGAILRGG